MKLSITKENEAKWIVSCYDYLQNNKQIGYNGFKEPSIVDAIQYPQFIPTTTNEDPFEGLSESDED